LGRWNQEHIHLIWHTTVCAGLLIALGGAAIAFNRLDIPRQSETERGQSILVGPAATDPPLGPEQEPDPGMQFAGRDDTQRNLADPASAMPATWHVHQISRIQVAVIVLPLGCSLLLFFSCWVAWLRPDANLPLMAAIIGGLAGSLMFLLGLEHVSWLGRGLNSPDGRAILGLLIGGGIALTLPLRMVFGVSLRPPETTDFRTGPADPSNNGR